MGTPGAALEPGGDTAVLAVIGRPGAAEGVLQQPGVALGRADEHGDLVEADAAAHVVEDPAGHLDAFAPFAWRREEPHLARGLAFERLLAREHPQPEGVEVGLPL